MEKLPPNKYFLFSEQRQLWFGLTIALVFLFAISISRIIYPYDVGEYEGGIWAPSALVINGHNPYSIPQTTQPPYTMSPYGIAYYLIVGLGIKLFGTQFWFARVISLLCVIICSLCIAKLVHRQTKNSNMAILGALLFIAQVPVIFWVGVQRPDLLALALSLLGMTSAFTMKNGKNNFLIIIMQALLVATAILVRQTSVLPILIISVWYLFTKAYVRLTVFLSSLLIFLSAVLFSLNQTSSGGYLWQQFIMPSFVSKSFSNGLSIFTPFITAPITISSLILWLFFYRSKRNDHDALDNMETVVEKSLYRKVFLIYVSLSLLLAIITASRIGSNLNYYIEVAAVISIIIPLYGGNISQGVRTGYIYSAILTLIWLSFSFRGIQTCRGEYYRWKSKKYYDEIVSVIKEKTSKDEPSYSVYPELIELAGRKYFFNDFVQYDSRAPLQHNVFEQVIKSHKLGAVVTNSDIVPGGYSRYKLLNPLPYKYYKAYLYFRDSADNSNIPPF